MRIVHLQQTTRLNTREATLESVEAEHSCVRTVDRGLHRSHTQRARTCQAERFHVSHHNDSPCPYGAVVDTQTLNRLRRCSTRSPSRASQPSGTRDPPRTFSR
ncbi:unnamed protein product [Ectocarpus sp. 12 AP-2014]